MQGLLCQMQGLLCQMQGLLCQMQGLLCQMQGLLCQMQGLQQLGCLLVQVLSPHQAGSPKDDQAGNVHTLRVLLGKLQQRAEID
jgi:hypothetical protein